MAILTTSIGIETMSFPLRLNITTIVKRSATSVIGLIAGTKRRWYHSFPFSFTPTSRVRAPARNGMPR